MSLLAFLMEAARPARQRAAYLDGKGGITLCPDFQGGGEWPSGTSETSAVDGHG